MKQYLHAFAMCQSMFCAIPAPQVWDENAKDKMLLFLPVIGLEIGLIWAAVAWLCNLLQLPRLITALVLSACPFLASGFLHLDGYMDVTDAVKSYRSPERRREILKDSHVGSFAVIGGAYQGKLDFAKENFGITDAEVYVCSTDEIDFSKRCICQIEEFTTHRADPVGYFEAHREEWQDSVLILRDIFCGVVPIGAENRAWRQRTGRLAQYLSREAVQVSRIFCGLEQRLK